MRPIVNFNRLNGNSITTSNGNSFMFEIGMHERNDLYIFDGGDSLHPLQGKYCTLMTINWDVNTFDIRKCILGQGTAGEDIETGVRLPTNRMKSMDDFILFIEELIVGISKIGSYKN